MTISPAAPAHSIDEVVLDEPGLRISAAGPSASASVTGSAADSGSDSVPSYRDLFRVREYVALFAAESTSMLGDQVAAVAVAVLLYQRSGSALLAALGYATTYLPWAIGGPLLSVLADRLPARRVMVSCDLARAAMFALAAVPGIPLAAVAALVLVSAVLAPPCDAAISATLPRILDDERYGLAISVRSTVIQVSLLAGFAGGGLLVALLSPGGALLLNAATFAVSGLVLLARVRPRPAVLADADSAGLWRDALAGLQVVAADRRRFGPLLLGMAGAAYIVVPEGIATAYAHLLGYGAGGVGVLMAAVAAGTALGAVLAARLLSESARRRLMWPMALLGVVPLALCATGPGLGGTLALFVLAGLCSSFQVSANTAFARAVPDEARGRAFGLAMTGMYAVQSSAVILGGVAASLWSANLVVAGAAVVGGVVVLALRPLVVARPACAAHRVITVA